MAQTLGSATRWLTAGSLAAAAGFALLLVDAAASAAAVGTAALLLWALAGNRVSAADRGDRESLDYPYGLGQRGRRLAIASIVGALAVAGYGLAPGLVVTLAGPTLFVFVAGLALLAPVLGLTFAIWTADGLSLSAKRESAGDPLIGAVGSMAVALAWATLATTTAVSVSAAALVVLGGLAPSLFLLWSLVRLSEQPSGTRPVG